MICANVGKKKSVRNSDIFHHHLQLCLQPTAADFGPERDQIFLGTVSFIQEFNFDKIVQEC